MSEHRPYGDWTPLIQGNASPEEELAALRAEVERLKRESDKNHNDWIEAMFIQSAKHEAQLSRLDDRERFMEFLLGATKPKDWTYDGIADAYIKFVKEG